MTSDQVYQVVDWVLRIVMAGISVLFVIVSREKAAADKALERRFREVDTRFETAEKALAWRFSEVEARFATTAHALQQELLLRDERIDTVRQQIANAAEQSSKTEGKVTKRIDDIRQDLAHFADRMTRLETEHDGRHQRRNS